MTFALRGALTAALLAIPSGFTFAANAPTASRVALLFTDGPAPGQTEKCLEILAQENIRATFASVGTRIVAHPALTSTVHAAGHEVVNHSYTRPHFRDLSIDVIQREVRTTSNLIQETTGQPPAWFWAPFLEMDDRITAAVAATDIAPFPIADKYVISTEDWNPALDAAAIQKRATTGIRDRTIIVFHEWRPETIARLPAIVAELKRQGCEFLTFSELASLPSPKLR